MNQTEKKMEVMVKNFLIMYIIIVCLSFLGCTATHHNNSLNKLTNEEIEAYNNDPNNTDKIVCRTESAVGSRIPARSCHMESAIDERARQDQQSLSTIQRTQTIGTMPEGGPSGR